MNSLFPITILAALETVPALAFVLQVVGVASAVGTAVALRAHRRWDAEAWPITAAWASAGLIAGVAIEIAAIAIDAL